MTATTVKQYNVVYSPRGFSNELALRKFDTLKEANEFKSEIDNAQDSWTLESKDSKYKMVVREADKADHDFMYGDFRIILEDS